MIDLEEKKYDLKKVKAIMKDVCSKNNLRLVFLKADNGYGGYNYGASAGDSIMLAPFKKGHKGDQIGRYALTSDCYNPVECMLITFFHEFAHCCLAHKVPSNLKGFSWNDTSAFQYELWISMLGVEYAHKHYGIKFSDMTMEWLLDENRTYIKYNWKAEDNGLHIKKVSTRSYTIVGLPKNIFKKGRS